MRPLAVTAHRLITPRRLLPDHVVLSQGNTITEIGPVGEVSIPRSADRIEAPDGFVVPGFVDLQVNGAFGVDVATATVDELLDLSRQLAAVGTTSFLPTVITGSHEDTIRAIGTIRQASEQPSQGAEILGMHLEGPFISEEKRGTHPARYVRKPSLAETESFLEESGGRLRMLTLAPEAEHAEEVIRLLSSRGVAVSIGHTSASFDQTIAAIDAGAVMATHTLNAMSALHHRVPGVVGAVLADGRIHAGAIADGIHLHPSVVRLIYLAKGPHRFVLVTDSMAAAGLGDGVFRLGQSVRVTVLEGKAVDQDGTLAGSTLTMCDAVRKAVAFTGASLARMISSASLVPARVLSVSDRKGEIAPGRYADFVVLSEELVPTAVVARGRIVRGGERDPCEGRSV